MSRLAVCAALFVVSGLLVVQRAEPLVAQDKTKKDDPVMTLQKQVMSLQRDLQVAAAQLNAAQTAAVQATQQAAQQKAVANKALADAAQLDAALKKEKADGAKADKTIKELQSSLDGVRKVGLVRVLVLKLKEDSPANEVGSLIDAAHALSKVKGVRVVWAGKPAGGPKAKASGEVETDYTVAVVLAFEDAAAYKSFLKDAAYEKFADRHFKLWEAPTIYDIAPSKAP